MNNLKWFNIKFFFNNDIHEFTDRGMEWVKNKIQQEKTATTPIEQPKTEVQGE